MEGSQACSSNSTHLCINKNKQNRIKELKICANGLERKNNLYRTYS